jgi:subtilisin family serine protease
MPAKSARPLLGLFGVCALVTACQPPGAAPAPAASATRQALVVAPGAAPPSAMPTRTPATSGPATRVIVKLRGAAGARSVAGAAAPEVLQRHGLHRARALFPGRARAATVRAARAPSGATAPDLGGVYAVDLAALSERERERKLLALRRDPAVVYVEEDRPMRAFLVPDDPRYPELYGMSKISAPQAWDTARGAGAVVAVIDSGLDFGHPDIDANVWTNAGEIPGNGLDDDDNGFADDVRGWDFVGPSAGAPVPDSDPTDEEGHGTHVAGTVAAEGNNGLGVIGVAWQARVMALRGLDSEGFGGQAELAGAVVYATDQGADVINASWGATGVTQTLRDAVAYALANGVVFVASAGNANLDVGQFYPASLPGVIAVSAIGPADEKADFSNFGSGIELAAPGVGILSLQRGTGDYFPLDGTSMAAPHVSGVIALVLGRRPTFTVDEVRQVLRSTATDLGGAGKDIVYGYGRVNAAGAVLVDRVLEARITAPVSGVALAGPVTVTGSAQGTGFVRYTLEHGAGVAPTSWTTIRQSTTPVTGGVLGTFDPSPLPEGIYSLRLRAEDGARTYFDQVTVEVRYASIAAPAPAPAPVLDGVFKPGTAITVAGRASGPGFVRYRVEWAPGRDATSGFSSAGVVLTGGGTSPVIDGPLASWTPVAGTRGPHTIRLTVEATPARVRTSSVYLEPDLLAPGWPRHVDLLTLSDSSASPVRQADGRLGLVMCGFINPRCVLHAPDGTPRTAALTDGTSFQPPVGELDPSPGEEIVVGDARLLRIFAADLTQLRSIDAGAGHVFSSDVTSLADVDGDGALEILAIRRSNDNSVAALQVFRGSGEPLAGSPIPVTTAGLELPVLAVDLDGDRRKELLVADIDPETQQQRLLAYTSTGAPHAGWTSTWLPPGGTFPTAADLDRDGRPEIVVLHQGPHQQALYLFDSTGALRPGWPRTTANGLLQNPGVSIGDLDRDGRDEIVVNQADGLLVLGPDGGEVARHVWTSFGAPGRAVIADVDGDGFPDLTTGYTLLQSLNGFEYLDWRLRAITRTGALIREWPMHGIAGEQAYTPVPIVADFDGDGRADIATRQSLIAGGAHFGGLGFSVLRIMTTSAPFDPATADWPLVFHDAQVSRSRAASASIGIGAAADAYVRDGSSAGSNFGTATTLQAKTSGAAGNSRWSYLRFPLGGVGGAVASARLRLHGSRSQTSAVTLAAFGVSNTSWSETAITWNNKPALGPKQGDSVLVTPTARRYEWDVTAFVKAQRAAGATAVTLAIKMDQSVNDSPDSFASREASSNRPELVVTLAPPPPPVTVSPVADAYVRDGSSAGTNFGNATTLEVKTTTASSATRIAYLRFPLTAVPASVGRARLRLHGSRPVTSTATDAAFAVSNNSWSETGITWNNRPALGAVQGASVTITPTAGYHEWDVTAFVRAQKAAGATAVSLAVKMDQAVSHGPDSFSSRQAASNRPQLVVSAP